MYMYSVSGMESNNKVCTAAFLCQKDNRLQSTQKSPSNTAFTFYLTDLFPELLGLGLVA